MAKDKNPSYFNFEFTELNSLSNWINSPEAFLNHNLQTAIIRSFLLFLLSTTSLREWHGCSVFTNYLEADRLVKGLITNIHKNWWVYVHLHEWLSCRMLYQGWGRNVLWSKPVMEKKHYLKQSFQVSFRKTIMIFKEFLSVCGS